MNFHSNITNRNDKSQSNHQGGKMVMVIIINMQMNN